MSEEEHLELVKGFIYNDEVQHILSSINDNLMDFNILEITGMGNQEIKHSNILGWLFDDSEHNLEYQILDNFLKNVIEENRKSEEYKIVLDALQSYIYLADNKKAITIYREKDNIDLLIVDEANKVVITIENKVYASERIDGTSDEGQLSKYEININNKYPSKEQNVNDGYDKYFIFLTIDLEKPSRRNWLTASHQMVTDVIYDMLKTKKDITTKTKIILESYVDLLKRNGIVADNKLEELCKKIWDKPEYEQAFKIIFNNKPNQLELIKKILKEKTIFIDEKKSGDIYNFFIKFDEKSLLIYRLIYDTKGKGLGFVIVARDDDKNKTTKFKTIMINDITLKINAKLLTEKPEKQFGYIMVSTFSNYCISENDIGESIIIKLLEEFREFDLTF